MADNQILKDNQGKNDEASLIIINIQAEEIINLRCKVDELKKQVRKLEKNQITETNTKLQTTFETSKTVQAEEEASDVQPNRKSELHQATVTNSNAAVPASTNFDANLCSGDFVKRRKDFCSNKQCQLLLQNSERNLLIIKEKLKEITKDKEFAIEKAEIFKKQLLDQKKIIEAITGMKDADTIENKTYLSKKQMKVLQDEIEFERKEKEKYKKECEEWKHGNAPMKHDSGCLEQRIGELNLKPGNFQDQSYTMSMFPNAHLTSKCEKASNQRAVSHQLINHQRLQPTPQVAAKNHPQQQQQQRRIGFPSVSHTYQNQVAHRHHHNAAAGSSGNQPLTSPKVEKDRPNSSSSPDALQSPQTSARS